MRGVREQFAIRRRIIAFLCAACVCTFVPQFRAETFPLKSYTMADALASGFNVFAGHWLAASGAVEITRGGQVVDVATAHGPVRVRRPR